ncbi:tRNA(Ile)-lysidine synthase [Hasllibacter halocynthiae]|uniref:tRNA(Ile)-lysidine synthetase n=2 Tax=Hasllibacter halocynthiae TaxID=595589 RepID=A0A2T0X9M4_9RHOB|nr:tRNA(Ile)-lysidine synthase [Hasllibacter halocynthiae]
MHLAALEGVPARAATVDHGLRRSSAAEARAVGAAAAALGLAHATLRWADPPRDAGQGPARAARLRLLRGWARREGLSAVLTGHTLDDQAETVLMALRGGGVDALSAMPDTSPCGLFRRPLLGTPREALRSWLRAAGIPWVEDPANDDPRHARTHARRALAGMPLGTAAALARVAALAAERRSLEEAEAARRLEGAGCDGGLAAAPLLGLPTPIRRRAWRLALTREGRAPRGRDVAALDRAMLAGAAARTLNGIVIRRRGPLLTLVPEVVGRGAGGDDPSSEGFAR